MFTVSDDQFQQLIDEALGSLKGEHAEGIKNVAILFNDEPTLEQRENLKLRPDQSLYGLFEGVSLPARQGRTDVGPSVITLFKGPLNASSHSLAELKENIRHTLWHEIAHYYGLNHAKIRGLE